MGTVVNEFLRGWSARDRELGCAWETTEWSCTDLIRDQTPVVQPSVISRG